MGVLARSDYEMFAQELHKTGSRNQSDSYRKVYPDKVATYKNITINNEASKLSRNPIIKNRLAELREELREAHGVTTQGLIRDLEEVYQVAKNAETPQCSAAVKALMSQAKLVGLDIVKVDHSSTDGTMTPSIGMSDEQLQAIIDSGE